MEFFNKIYELFQITDKALRNELLKAEESANDENVEIFKERVKLNEKAYFLFLFTKFEKIIRDKSAELIKEKTKGYNKKNWREKRAWYILPEKPYIERGDMSFLNRLYLLFLRESEDCKDIMDYYKLRNKLAHGQDYNEEEYPIVIDLVVDNFNRYVEMLNKDLLK